VIGTMNTADRSVEAFDAALRRRFVFERIAPDASVLADHQPDGLDVDLERLLETFNSRLEGLLDRDHCIGQAYLIGLDRERAPESLRALVAMLQATGQLDLQAGGDAPQSLSKAPLFELFMQQLLAEAEALLRRGLRRGDRDSLGNLPVLKGRIHLPGSFRCAGGLTGCVAVVLPRVSGARSTWDETLPA